jgi:hypothetical protein
MKYQYIFEKIDALIARRKSIGIKPEFIIMGFEQYNQWTWAIGQYPYRLSDAQRNLFGHRWKYRGLQVIIVRRKSILEIAGNPIAELSQLYGITEESSSGGPDPLKVFEDKGRERARDTVTSPPDKT